MNEKLFLDSFLDWGAKKLDAVVFLKGPADVVDGHIFRGAFGLVNNAISKKVLVELYDGFHAAQEKIVAADYDDAAADALGEFIEIVQGSEKLTEKQKAFIVATLELIKSVLSGLD